MNLSDTVIDRNATFAGHGYRPELRIMPVLKTIVIGCVDPRVDPTEVLGTGPGDVAAIRNVGGRVTPGVLAELAMLRRVTQSAGGDIGAGWELVVLHHTDCGITRLVDEPLMLAGFLGIDAADVDQGTITDPWRSVAQDVAALRQNRPGVRVTGYVYDVTTGLIDPVSVA
jgi:carbonic anhydrase